MPENDGPRGADLSLVNQFLLAQPCQQRGFIGRWQLRHACERNGGAKRFVVFPVVFYEEVVGSELHAMEVVPNDPIFLNRDSNSTVARVNHVRATQLDLIARNSSRQQRAMAFVFVRHNC